MPGEGGAGWLPGPGMVTIVPGADVGRPCALTRGQGCPT